jgi:hypothetical protein
MNIIFEHLDSQGFQNFPASRISAAAPRNIFSNNAHRF